VHSKSGVRVVMLLGMGAVLGVMPGQSVGQPVDFAERMPAETLLYLGWTGCDYAGVAAKDTAMGRTLADPQVRRFFGDLDQALDGLLRQAAVEEVGVEAYDAARRMVFDIFRHPGALAVIDFGFGESGPIAQAALVLELGDRARGFAADFRTVLDKTPLPPPQPATVAGRSMEQLFVPVPGGVFFGAADGKFVLAVGTETVQRLLASPSDDTPSLAGSPQMALSRKQLNSDPHTRGMCLYLDVAGLLERARMLVPMFVQEQDKQALIWQLVDGLGLSSLRSLCWELHYRGAGCYSAVFLHTEGPPKGLLAIGSATPVAEDDLALIPKEPYWGTVFSIEPGRIYAEAMSLMKQIDAEAHQEAADLVAELEKSLALRLDEDLLDLIGSTVVAYDAAENGGLWFTGTTVIADSTDPERLQGSIRKIIQAVARMVAEEDEDVSLGLSSTSYRDHRIEYLNLTGVPMPVAPAWTVHQKRIVVGLYPQMVMAAVDRLLDASPEDSLATNPDFARARKTLGGLGSSVTYLDTRRAIEQLYAVALPLAQMGLSMGQSEGLKLDVSSLPGRRPLTQHLFAHVSTAKREESGVLCSSYGPLPFGVPSVAESAGGTTVMATAILLPSLSRARALSKRVVSATNLRIVGQGCLVYANDHNEAFPPDLQTLLDEGYLTAENLRAPNDETGGVSYVYIAGHHAAHVRWDSVVAHERTDLNDGEGVNVLFGDMHVEFVEPERFERLLQQTKQRLAERQRQ